MSNVVSIAAPNSRLPAFLPAWSNLAMFAGVLVSLACTAWAGRLNRSFVLVALFTVWVLLPFPGLLWARRFAYWYQFAAQVMVFALIFLVSIGSAVFYAIAAFGLRWAHPALPFLAAPLISWFLIGTVALVIRLSFGGRFRQSGRV